MDTSTRDRLVAGLISRIAVMAVGTLSVGGTSHAADMSGEERNQVRVHFGDLDLSKADGVNVLRRRIQLPPRAYVIQGCSILRWQTYECKNV